jgi:hypothetical protein
LGYLSLSSSRVEILVDRKILNRPKDACSKQGGIAVGNNVRDSVNTTKKSADMAGINNNDVRDGGRESRDNNGGGEDKHGNRGREHCVTESVWV